MRRTSREDEQRSYFEQYDLNLDGQITQQELHEKLEGNLTAAKMAKFAASDLNRDALVDYGEFKQATASCPTGCCEKTCGSCVEEQDLYGSTSGCRWCAAARTCRNRFSLLRTCDVGINSRGQCWSERCPYQQGHFLAVRTASAKAWVTRSVRDALRPLQAFPTYPARTTGLFDLISGKPLSDARLGSAADDFIIAAASDWGSATCEARVVARLMELEKPGMTLHLGDVYYNGLPEEFDFAVRGMPPNKHQIGVSWPKGSVTSFLLNANHEMISGGKGLFENGFEYTGQQTTYGVWQSDSWRFVALDTGYSAYNLALGGKRNLASESDAPQPQEIIDWLINVVKLGDPDDKRGIVIFTHHQVFDAWEKPYLGTARQLNDILPEGKTVVWFFGHVHALALYDKIKISDGKNFTTKFAILPRLIGHGGFPAEVSKPKSPEAVVAYDSRFYQSLPQGGGSTPMSAGFHGFIRMDVHGPSLKVSYVTGKCKSSGCDDGYDEQEGTLLATEDITVDLATGQLKQSWSNLHEDLVVFTKIKTESDVPLTVVVDVHEGKTCPPEPWHSPEGCPRVIKTR